MYRCVAFLGIVAVCTPSAAVAQSLTLEEALQRARESAPLVIAARARVEEARARLVDASQRWREQPTLDGASGPRRGATTSWDVELGVEQVFETGGQRAARISAAQAGIEREGSLADDMMRRHLRDTAAAYLAAVAADERLAFARKQFELASELLRATERRFSAGDIAAVDVNLAQIALARADAATADAEADYETAAGSLRRLLGSAPDAPLALAGTLREYVQRFRPAAAASVDERPELRALRAERREADADLLLGGAMRRPDVGARASYEREDGDQVALLGLSIRLPFVDRGAALRAASTARQRRIDLELAALRQSLHVEADTARRVYERHARAAQVMETTALPAVLDNETLALKSYEAGQIGLLDLLLLQREAIEVRQLHVDHLLDAAVAGLELAAATGGLR